MAAYAVGNRSKNRMVTSFLLNNRDATLLAMVQTHRRTGQHPFGGGGVKPTFARMANTTCFSRGPARDKKQ